MKKRAVGRPRKEPGEILVDLPFKVDPEALEIVEQIAAQLDRPRGWAARRLLMRGIEIYSHDIQNMRPEDAIRMHETAAEIIRRLEAVGDTRFTGSSGFEVTTGRQWGEEETEGREDLAEKK